MDKSNAKAKLQEHLITINSIRAIRKDLAAGRISLDDAIRKVNNL